MRNQVFLFRGVAPCGYVNCSRSFEGKCRHHLQGYESILNHEDYGLTLLRNSGSNDTAITHTRSNKPEEVVLQYENRFAKSKICQSCVISIGYSDNLTATLAVSFAAVFSLSLSLSLSLAFTHAARYYCRFSYIGMNAEQNTLYCILYVSLSHTHTHTNTRAHAHARTHDPASCEKFSNEYPAARTS